MNGKKTGGRKKGVPNKMTIDKLVAIEAGGELPLDYMLRVMRDPSVDHERRDDMAGKAARYCHAALSESKNQHTHGVTDKFAEFLAELARARIRIHDQRP